MNEHPLGSQPTTNQTVAGTPAGNKPAAPNNHANQTDRNQQGAQTRAPQKAKIPQQHPAPQARPQAARPHGSHAAPRPKTARAHAKPGSAPTADEKPRAGKSRYLPALDGIRALAVVAVVLYHLNLTWIQGGLLGVTMFFVISGYIITRLLLNEFEQSGRIDLKSFWIRRARRLLPAIGVLMVVTIVLCTFFNHVMLTKMRPDILPSLFFVNNWWQIAQNVSYFDALGDPSPLTHFWSLAIEEQFYLIWPPLLLGLLSTHVKKPTVRRIVLGLSAVSALAMTLLYNPAVDPSRIYYGTDTRVFSLLLGVWLAFIPPRDMSPARLVRALGLDALAGGVKTTTGDAAIKAAANDPAGGDTDDDGRAPESPAAARGAIALTSIDLVGFIGLAGLLALFMLSNGYSAFQYRGGMLLCSVFTMMLIAACVQDDGLLVRLFSLKPFVWIGKRSYSIYLWHYPLLLLMNPVADIRQTPWWMTAIQLAVVVAVAECSYRFIETPFRHGALGTCIRRVRQGEEPLQMIQRHIVPFGIAGVTLLFAVGGLVFVPNTSALSEEGAALLEGNGGGEPSEPSDNGDAAASDGEVETDKDGFPAGAYDVLMIGDSVSLRTIPNFEQTFPHGHIDAAKNRQFTTGVDLASQYIAGNQAGKIVVIALGTNGLVTDENTDQMMSLLGDKRVVVFMTTRSPQPWVGPTNEAIARAAERYANVRIIDWYGFSEGRNDLFDGDGTHLSSDGAEQFIQLVYDTVRPDLPLHAEDHPEQQVIERANELAGSATSSIAAAAKAGAGQEPAKN